MTEFEATALLAWQWSEYLERNDPGVEFPWQMPVDARQAALVEVLREAVYIEASNDGADVEDRKFFPDDPGDD